MKKIVFVNIFGGRGGGGEVYLNRLIDLFITSNKYSCFLISPSCEALNANQVKKFSCVSLFVNGYFKLFIRFIIAVIQVNYRLSRIRPDIIIINGDRALFLTPFIIYKCRVVGVKHMLVNSPLKRLLNRIVLIRLDFLVAISKYHTKHYEEVLGRKLCAKKVRLIYNSVDNNIFIGKERDLLNGNIRFIELATLERRKGQLDLIKAFYLLHKESSNCELWLVGEGDGRKEIEKLITELNLDGAVRLLGHKIDVCGLINSCDVMVLPSYDEGLPLSILEALSCSRPVIASSIAGITEVLEGHRCGILIEPGSQSDLTSALRFFIEEPMQIKTMGYNGLNRVKSEFGREKWRESWLMLVNEL